MAEKQSQETQEHGPNGVLHLYKNGSLRVFPNRAQADAAAVRTGGQAYQSPSSRRFLVRFPASQHEPEASPATKSVYELLLACPDDQTIRLKNAWKDVAAGNWKGAAHWLRNASRDGTTEWHDECAVLAIEYENK